MPKNGYPTVSELRNARARAAARRYTHDMAATNFLRARKPSTRASTKARRSDNGAKQLNNLAHYFRRIAHRAPRMPSWQEKNNENRGISVTLYRGLYVDDKIKFLHKLLTKGFLEDKGFVSFSRWAGMAYQFSGGNGIMLQLPVSSIPKGTPYIWYSPCPRNKGRCAPTTEPQDREVLLPPGKFVLNKTQAAGIKRRLEHALAQPRTVQTLFGEYTRDPIDEFRYDVTQLKVTFQPSATATNSRGRKIVQRKRT